MSAAEHVVREFFVGEGLSPHAWSNGPGDEYPTHTHPHDKVLGCVAGSIIFHTPDGDVVLSAGELFDLPAGTPHSATVGPDGVRCLEAVRD